MLLRANFNSSVANNIIEDIPNSRGARMKISNSLENIDPTMDYPLNFKKNISSLEAEGVKSGLEKINEISNIKKR